MGVSAEVKFTSAGAPAAGVGAGRAPRASGGLAGGGGAGPIGPNFVRMPRSTRMRCENGYRSPSIVSVRRLRSASVSSSGQVEQQLRSAPAQHLDPE